jgi:serine/threonine protein kinase
VYTACSKYKRSKLLGEGTYGEVWSCIRTEDGKDGFAVKFVEKRDAWAISDVLREINILARLRGCPHIVHYYECFDEAARCASVA